MKVTANTTDLLIFKHAAMPNLLVPSAFLAVCMALCTTLGLSESVGVGVCALGVGTLRVWLAARAVEQVRVVFDKTAGHVDLHSRVRLRDTHEARFEPDEIARVEVEETPARDSDTSTHRLYKLILVIAEGANAGRTRSPLPGSGIATCPVWPKNITHWLKRTQ